MTKKRASEDGSESPTGKKPKGSSNVIGISRSISACQRCRTKKIKCDQNFPKCSKCEKAQVECVGLDPATGREVPRSYVIHLEDRIASLEKVLKEKGLDPSMIESDKPTTENNDEEKVEQQQQGILLNQVNFSTMSPPNNRPQSNSHAISFARLMSTAVKFKDRKSNFTNTPELEMDPTTLNSSSKDELRPALLPPKKTAQEFIRVFFAQSNSQLPIIHREEFLKYCFLPVYGKMDDDILLASNYTAINTSSFKKDPYYEDETLTWFYQYKQEFNTRIQNCKQNNLEVDAYKISSEIIPPSKFCKPLYFLNIVFAIASSTHHLQYPSNISDSLKLAAARYIDQVYTSHDQLEALQGLLLMALYSIMRPTIPGCWYVVGSALRLCIDLGLHSESINQNLKVDSFTLDKRRRLFWCTYSLDRQISFYLCRPDGIPDEYITTPFPSELDDALIVPHDDKVSDYSSSSSGMASYKSISISMFKIRKIQSEVQRMLFGNAELPRRFNSILEWKLHITKLLRDWKNSAPKTRRKMNCDFNLDFFGLNYNHTLLIIHGLSPKNFKLNKRDVFKVNESAKELINIYTQLLSNKCINYTWAAVLNLFMAGTSYLYTIYNSEPIREENSLYEVKKITQECITVLNSLVDRCDAATTCKDIFEVLTAAVVKIKYNQTVQGSTKFNLDKFNISRGYSNSNLNSLVENIKSQLNDVKEERDQAPRNEIESFSMKLEHELNPLNFPLPLSKSPEILSDAPSTQLYKPMISTTFSLMELSGQTPSTFEWTNSDPMYENQLETFFDELQKSPNSSASHKDSPREGEFSTHFINPQHSNVSATPYSNDSNGSSKSSPVILTSNINQSGASSGLRYLGDLSSVDMVSNIPSRDGRKVYEMIHQVPMDPIWDQFFTNNTNPFYMNFDGSPQ